MSAPALSLHPTPSVEIPTRLFGPLQVRADSFISFPDGLPGFAGERRFVLLPAAPDGVCWLQAVDEPTLVFLLVDPFVACPGYSVDLPELPAEAVPPLVMTIATLPKGPTAQCTVNLQAPLLLDLGRRTGRQEILPDSGYSSRHPLDLAGLSG